MLTILHAHRVSDAPAVFVASTVNTQRRFNRRGRIVNRHRRGVALHQVLIVAARGLGSINAHRIALAVLVNVVALYRKRSRSAARSVHRNRDSRAVGQRQNQIAARHRVAQRGTDRGRPAAFVYRHIAQSHRRGVLAVEVDVGNQSRRRGL